MLASWPKPNYVDPERRTWMPAFSLTWQIVSTLLVFGRFYLRLRRLAGPFGYDDAFMLLAWVRSIETAHESCISLTKALSVSQLISVGFTVGAWILTIDLGVDRHTWDVETSKYAPTALVSSRRLH